MDIQPLEALVPEGGRQGGVDVGRVIGVPAFLGRQMLQGGQRIRFQGFVPENLERLVKILLAAHSGMLAHRPAGRQIFLLRPLKSLKMTRLCSTKSS